MNLQQAIDGYLIQSQVENKTAKTIANLRWQLGKFREWKGDVTLDQVTTQHIREYILVQQNKKLSGYSVHTCYKVIKAFFRWAIREELITRDPVEKVTAPKFPQLLPKVLAPEKLDTFLKHLKKDTSLLGRRNHLIVMLLLDTGLRANGLVTLCMEDVYLESSYLLVREGKGRKQRAVPISPTLRRHLWRYMIDWRAQFNPRVNNLFVNKFGMKLNVLSLETMIKREMAAVGMQGGPHVLRHTCATLYMRNGGDLERLRLLLGHSSVKTTQRYTHLIPEDLIKRHTEVSPLESVTRAAAA